MFGGLLPSVLAPVRLGMRNPLQPVLSVLLMGALVCAVGMMTLSVRPALGAPPEGVNIPPYAPFAAKDPLPMVIRSAIQAVTGKIDKIAFDPQRYWVFVTSVRTNTVLVLSLKNHKVVARLKDLPEPRGVVWLAQAQRLVVACGGDGSVHVFKPGEDIESKSGEEVSFVAESRTAFVGEADDLLVETDSRDRATVFVAHAMSVHQFDVLKAAKGTEIRLPGRAEGMALGTVNGERRLYVNIPRPDRTEKDQDPKPLVVMIDPDQQAILSAWPLSDARGNGAIALDAQNARLFVATRNPTKVLVLDAVTGEEKARLDAPGDVGRLCYDALTQRLYAPGGAGNGSIAVYQRTGVGAPLDKEAKRDVLEGDKPNIDTYARVHDSPTMPGCRTAVLDANERLLIAATPPLGADPVFVYVYLIGP